jgi:hypothetical protein
VLLAASFSFWPERELIVGGSNVFTPEVKSDFSRVHLVLLKKERKKLLGGGIENDNSS